MPIYRRNLLLGGTYFFTANLADRRLKLLTENIDLLRAAFRCVRGTAFLYDRRRRDPAGSPAYDLDLARGRCGFRPALAPDQKRLFAPFSRLTWVALGRADLYQPRR